MGFFESWSSPWGKFFTFLNGLIAITLPLVGLLLLPITILNWLVEDYLGQTILGRLEQVGDALDALALDLDLSSVAVDLSQVACFFPVTFFFTLLASYLALWLLVVTIKWIMKFIPTIG